MDWRCVTSRPERKPERHRGDGRNDRGPHHWRDAFRTPAARGIVGGVVEFAIHKTRPLHWKSSQPNYRKIARTLSHNDAFSRSPSWRDGAGCAALTGSDAGKLSINPVSSRAWVSRSATAACRGLAACLSWAAGSNLSAMLSLHGRDNARNIPRFHPLPWPVRQARATAHPAKSCRRLFQRS